MNRPRLVLTELREYRSERTGSTYFAGYLGKARVVMLRDDRAKVTGKEVARWNVLLEEPEPREDRENRAGAAQGGRGGPRTGLGASASRVGKPRRQAAAAAQPVAMRSARPGPAALAAPALPPIARPAICYASAASIPRTR